MDFLGLKSVWMERKETKRKKKIIRTENRGSQKWKIQRRTTRGLDGGEQVKRDLEASGSYGTLSSRKVKNYRMN